VVQALQAGDTSRARRGSPRWSLPVGTRQAREARWTGHGRVQKHGRGWSPGFTLVSLANPAATSFVAIFWAAAPFRLGGAAMQRSSRHLVRRPWRCGPSHRE
jgi:hypothetical protein